MMESDRMTGLLVGRKKTRKRRVLTEVGVENPQPAG
jgi:hypothetical protein